MSTNVMIAGSNYSLCIGTIGINGTLSEEFDLATYTLAGLKMENTTNGTLQFWTATTPAASGGVYAPIYNGDGTVYSVTLPVGTVAFSAAQIVNAIAPYRYIRLVTTVAQAAGPICKWVLKA